MQIEPFQLLGYPLQHRNKCVAAECINIKSVQSCPLQTEKPCVHG
jgi:hypothetical protein